MRCGDGLAELRFPVIDQAASAIVEFNKHRLSRRSMLSGKAVRPAGATEVQPVAATAVWANRRCSSNASAGVLQSGVLRGLVLRVSATAWRAFLL
jgi:hypothetical protein